MSYLVLARKYRPQAFSEVIGQEHVTRTLQNAITRGRIHHAFLFCGGRGTGKTTTARILAKALSCTNAPTPEPCNVCEACVEITTGSSVDVQEIDAASQNRVEDIRDLREAIRYAPVRGKKKLYILDEVHMLSTSAFNALLKTLEEPPPHAVFVFATTDPHKLPQTILSRVQRYDFKLVPTARLVDHLADVLGREAISFERGALQLIAREGAGSVRDSLSLLDQVLASTDGTLTEERAAAILGVADRALLLELGRAVVTRDPEAALSCIDRAYGRGYDLAQLSRALLGHLRDLVVLCVVKEPEALLEATGSELEELRRQAEAVRGSGELLFGRMVRIADEVSRSPLLRYVLEVGVIELCQVEPLLPLGDLIGRLELLEGRLGGGRGPLPGGGGPGRTPRAALPMEPAPRPVQRAAPTETVAPPPPLPAGADQREPAPERSVEAAHTPVHAHGDGGASSTSTPHLPHEAKGPSATEAAPAVRPFPDLISAVIGRSATLSVLASGRPLSWDGARLVLGFAKAFEVEQAEDKRAQIQKLLSEEAGGPVQIEVRHTPGALSEAKDAESLAEVQDRKSSEDRDKKRREALGHPARKQITEVFGDEVSFLEPVLE